MLIGGKEFDFDKHFYIMGILNVTPDSFSDGGKYYDMDSALFRVEEMIKEGADIIDVGGESTRPGHQKISEDFEIYRVVPAIEAIKRKFDVPVSLDTYKYKVAAAGIKAGVDLINDIWGLKWDSLNNEEGIQDDAVNFAMAKEIAKGKVPCCLMHNRHIEGDVKESYVNLIDDVVNDLKDSVDIALEFGIAKENIMLDPGIGFAKDCEQNLIMMNNLDKLCKLDYPVLLGASRKSMIGLTLDLPTDERMEGTVATSVIGYQKGCRIFRVHDVKENRRALQMTEAIMNS
ncbi:MAG: dihydropteroate synthase [Lachnospiraceae bacterium]|nr:dihydropteroate synthase [Lachnospiraceae bacterium]